MSESTTTTTTTTITPCVTTGASDPNANLGLDGDMYINVVTSRIFKKVDGAWHPVINVSGLGE